MSKPTVEELQQRYAHLASTVPKNPNKRWLTDDMVSAAMAEHGDVSKASAALGVPYVTLWKRLNGRRDGND
jgi:transcriptional regulator of acetoin/glycerol metabolism